MAKSSRALMFALFVAALVALASNPASGATTPGVSKDSIKIGMFAPFSGTNAQMGKIVNGIRAIYMDQNEKGGINGRKIEMVVEDDAGDPANAPVIFRKLVESHKVFMIHGGISSAPVLAMKPLIEQNPTPFLVISAVANKITDPPLRHLFTAFPVVADQSSVVAEFARSMNPKRVAVITQKDDWGKDWRAPFVAAMKQYGIEIVADEEIDNELGDATPWVRIVKRQQPDVIAMFAYGQPISVYLRDAYAQGVTVPVITGSGARPEDVLRRLGRREPVLKFFGTETLKYLFGSPEYEPYQKMFAKYFPNIIFESQVIDGMTGALANIEALKRAGNDLTWDGWIKAMESLKDFDTPALASPVTYKAFDPKDPSTRRGAKKASMRVLNPDPKGATALLVIKDWADYQKIAK